MIRIDDSLLEELGLASLPKAERDQLLRQIYETLEMRVGMKLAERMSDQQLDEFERFIDTNDEAGALKWLETNFPDYKQVVADELDKLKVEIKNDADKILQAMQQPQAPAAYSQNQQTPPPYQQPVAAPAPQAPGVAPAPQQPAYPPQPAMTPPPYQQQQPPASYPPVSPQQPASPPPQQPPATPPYNAPSPGSYDQNQQPPMAA